MSTPPPRSGLRTPYEYQIFISYHGGPHIDTFCMADTVLFASQNLLPENSRIVEVFEKENMNQYVKKIIKYTLQIHLFPIFLSKLLKRFYIKSVIKGSISKMNVANRVVFFIRICAEIC